MSPIPLLEQAVAQHVVDWENMPIPSWEIKPVCLGPTWRQNPSWQPGDDEADRYELPRWTLGWQILRWITENLLGDDGGPFQATPEQKRIILWWYAVDEFGRWQYRDGVLQRLKGWG